MYLYTLFNPSSSFAFLGTEVFSESVRISCEGREILRHHDHVQLQLLVDVPATCRPATHEPAI
jgi:hypothetical protein